MTMHESPGVFGDAGGDVGYRIVRQVASLEDADPVGLEPPLYEVVDVDALESLFHADGVHGTIAFSYLGHDVLVGADGTVTVTE